MSEVTEMEKHMSNSTLFVARGRTVMLGGTPNGPGAVVTLPADEAAFLQDRGFLTDTPPILAPAAGTNPAGIGLQNAGAQGPTYR
jgi:hypothetical protein